MKIKIAWPPKGTVQISSQITYDIANQILFFRKYKSVEIKVQLHNIVAIRVQRNDLYVSYREPQKIPFQPGFYVGTSTTIKKGTLKSIEKIFTREGFIRISRDRMVRAVKVAKGGSRKDFCEICYWDAWKKMWYVGEEYFVDKKYQERFQDFLDGKLFRPRKKRGVFIYGIVSKFMQHKAKKSLGQNFLKSAQAIRDIVGAGELSPKDTILEIGPGKGALTEALLQTGATVIAIEKDRELFAYLSEKFETEINSKKLLLIEGDALEFNPVDYSKGAHYKLIANIPYNITGLIFRKFLESDHQPERMVLLVQKEVAERIVARDDKESILSISVKAYGNPKIIAKVPARYFSPAPKVDSAIIAITSISRNNFTKLTEKRFFEVIHAGFAHKRKVLIKNLEEGLNLQKETLQSIWKTLELSPNVRAEELRVEHWFKISSILNRS